MTTNNVRPTRTLMERGGDYMRGILLMFFFQIQIKKLYDLSDTEDF